MKLLRTLIVTQAPKHHLRCISQLAVNFSDDKAEHLALYISISYALIRFAC